MRAYIGAFDLILFAGLVADDDDLDAPGLSQKWHGIADRPRRCPATVPANHDVVQLERLFLDIWDDDKRSAQIEQRGFDNVLLDRVGFRLRLSDNGQIEAPRDLAELVAGADQACAERQRFGLNARAYTCGREALPNIRAADYGFFARLPISTISLLRCRRPPARLWRSSAATILGTGTSRLPASAA